MDYNSEFSDEELQQLLAAGSAPEEIQNLYQQMALANEIRNAEGPQGRQAGRAYVAANPLEHLVDALRKRKAEKEYRTANEAIPGVQRRVADARKLYFQGPLSQRMKPEMQDFDAQVQAAPEPQLQIAQALRARSSGPRQQSPDEFMANYVDTSATPTAPQQPPPQRAGASASWDYPSPAVEAKVNPALNPNAMSTEQPYMTNQQLQAHKLRKMAERRRLGF